MCPIANALRGQLQRGVFGSGGKVFVFENVGDFVVEIVAEVYRFNFVILQENDNRLLCYSTHNGLSMRLDTHGCLDRYGFL